MFWVSVGSRHWLPSGELVLRRRLVAGLDVESAVSCVDDVGDVLALELEEPVDNPGTTICFIVFRVALDVSAIVTKCSFLTTGLLT